MYFIATRGKEKVTAEQAVVSGYPKGGGLFVPETFPQVTEQELMDMIGMSYAERAAFVLQKFFEQLDGEFLKEVCEKGYASFGDKDKDPLPIVRIDEGKYILELFHGPTCAYEDISVNLFPALFEKSKELCGDSSDKLFFMATSGDAGKAAMEIFKNKKGVKVAAFYPDETVSKMQRLALTIADGDNVYTAGIRGSFDDCKDVVEKAYFSEEMQKAVEEAGYTLATLSSANVARIIPQIACYFSAYLDLLSSEQIGEGERVDFAVPAGNGCNLVAGLYAKKMGLPIRKILCSSNRNKAFYELLKKGDADVGKAYHHTMSPSMDVVFPSNFERLVFEALARDPKKTQKAMEDAKKGGELVLSEEEKKRLTLDLYGGFASEDDTVDAVYAVFEEYGYAMDTHTGVAAAVCDKVREKRDEKDETPIVIMAVGNPYKFPQDALYALSGNDVKDSFKGIKRLNLLTAMKPPKFLVDMRYKLPRFKQILAADAKKVTAEVQEFLKGRKVPDPNADKK